MARSAPARLGGGLGRCVYEDDRWGVGDSLMSVPFWSCPSADAGAAENSGERRHQLPVNLPRRRCRDPRHERVLVAIGEENLNEAAWSLRPCPVVGTETFVAVRPARIGMSASGDKLRIGTPPMIVGGQSNRSSAPRSRRERPRSRPRRRASRFGRDPRGRAQEPVRRESFQHQRPATEWLVVHGEVAEANVAQLLVPELD